MSILDRILGRVPRSCIAVLCIGLIAAIGTFDYLTSVETLSALLYLLPVSLGAWCVGRPLGLALAALSTLTVLFVDRQHVLVLNLLGAAGILATVAVLVTSVKEQLKAERVSKQLIKGIIDAMPARVFWKDRNLDYLGCSASFARDAGFADPKDVIGKDDYQMAWRDRAEAYRSDDREVIDGGRSKLLAEGFVTTPQGPIAALTSKVPLRGFDGEICGVLGAYLDVTDRKRAEEALVVVSERLSLAMGVGKAGVWEWDVQRDEVTFDAAFHALLGYAPGELPHTAPEWKPYHHPEDLPSMMSRVEAYLKGESPTYESEHRVRTKAGSWAWVFTRGTVVDRTPAGAPRRFIGIAMNVTERRKEKETLEESEKKFRALFENMAAASCIEEVVYAEGKPVDYRVLEVNPAFERIIGVSRAQAVGSLATQLYGPGQPRLLAVYSKVAETGEPASFEGYFPTIGKHLHLTVSCPARGRLSTVFTDITERKRSDESLARLSTAVEQSAEAIVITNASGSIVYVNPAFEASTGYAREEAIGRNPRILNSGKQDHEFYRELWSTLTRGEVWRGRFTNKRKDGTFFEEDATISPVRDAAGQIVDFVAVKRDVTHETRLEQQLAQAQKMEAIGRLAGGVAHDFNNLLGVITGYAEIVHRRLTEEDPLKVKVEQIIKAGERAADLTRQLLAFGRKQVLQPRLIDLNSLVTNMQKMLPRLLGENVDLVALLEPALGSVRADPGQVDQILMNLAVNARDAMPEGGRITIETRNADLGQSYAATHGPVRPGPYVILEVTDTGSGMDAPTQARIFEPFFTTKGAGKGTGLGLSTVYGIVKQSDGYIWVYSEVGLGTTFRIYLPRVGEEAKNAVGHRPVALSRGHETILLVEDETSLREVLTEVLEANGYSVLVARDGSEALKWGAAHAAPIHLVVTDVIMPGLTGPGVVDLVAESRPEVKVLYMSGYSDEAVVRHGLIGPGRAFISKPFGPEAFLRKVRESLDASRAQDSEIGARTC